MFDKDDGSPLTVRPQIDASGEINDSRMKGKSALRTQGISVVTILVVIAILGLAAAILLPMLAKARDCACRPPSCIMNITQISAILEHYMEENDGRYPPIDECRNNFIFDEAFTLPGYAPDTCYPLDCPASVDFTKNKHAKIHKYYDDLKASKGSGSPECITDRSYCYLGWFVTNDEEATTFFEAYDNLSPEFFDEDIIVPEGKGNGGGDVIHRLDSDAGRFLGDPPIKVSNIPVMWDRPSTDPSNFSHKPAGGNVLYLDGKVEFVKFGEKFPMTETMARLLDERKRDPIPGCEE